MTRAAALGLLAVAPAALAVARLDQPGGPLVLLEESHDLPLVSFELTLRSGHVADPPGKEGLGEITARLLRRGAAGKTSRRIDETIDRLGATLDMDVGASSTSVRGEVLRRNLEPFLGLVGEIVTRPDFPPRELERLRREMIAEVQGMRDDDESLASRHFRKALFGSHPYARPAGGTEASLAAITLGDVRAHYRKYWVRPNAIVGAAGDVDRETLQEIVDESFAKLRKARRPRVKLGPPTMPAGRRLVLVDKPERTQAQVYLGHLGLRPVDDDYFPLVVANTAFGGTFTARLMKEIRSERGLSYGAYSRLGRDRQPHGFWLWTFPASADLARCVALEIELLERFVTEGITEDELAFAKSYLVKSRAFDFDTAAKRLSLAMDEEILGLPAGYHARWTASVDAVTLAQANEAIRRRIQTNDLTITVVATASEVREALEQAIPRLGGVEVVPYDSD